LVLARAHQIKNFKFFIENQNSPIKLTTHNFFSFLLSLTENNTDISDMGLFNGSYHFVNSVLCCRCCVSNNLCLILIFDFAVAGVAVVVKLFQLSFQALAMSLLQQQQQPVINKKCTNLN
jgi:hypothetical protein